MIVASTNNVTKLVITALDYVGGVPFDILQPVLAKATASQLYNIEDCNPVSPLGDTYFMLNSLYFCSLIFSFEIVVIKFEVEIIKWCYS